jgi:hypothetical protein
MRGLEFTVAADHTRRSAVAATGQPLQAGLRVRAELDRSRYPLGVRVRDRELATVPLARHEFHGGEVGGWLGVG